MDTAQKSTALVWKMETYSTIMQALLEYMENGIQSQRNVSLVTENAIGAIRHCVIGNQLYLEIRNFRCRYDITMGQTKNPGFQYKEKIFELSECACGELNAEAKEQQSAHAEDQLKIKQEQLLAGNPVINRMKFDIDSTKVDSSHATKKVGVVMTEALKNVKDSAENLDALTRAFLGNHLNVISTGNRLAAVGNESGLMTVHWRK